jgi:hypothetical protein
VTFASQSRYWFVTIQCVDRSKLLFDTVCTLADMDYDVYHAAIDSSSAADGTLLANQEFYIRPRLGMAEWDGVKAEKLRSMLRAAIMRRFPHGLKISLQCTQVRPSADRTVSRMWLMGPVPSGLYASFWLVCKLDGLTRSSTSQLWCARNPSGGHARSSIETGQVC